MIGAVSQSCQLAPFDVWYQPNTDFIEVYDDSITLLNSYQGAPFQQAMSGLTNLNNDWYNGKDYATYSFYYQPGSSGQITWSVADTAAWKLDARAIGPNGNVGQRVIPQEPMALIMNFGMSTGFSALNLTGIATTLPATMRFDYVRIYQESGSTSVTCDPSGYETTGYINDHMDAYTNPNKTQWHQTNHPWPKNTFIDKCKS
ncbi:beta-glucan synthesis-associated protein KRE6, partial [Lecanoromycetidae sp. Uapishka_2]